MKLIDQNVGVLSNSELLTVLRERGADDTVGISKALASEKLAYQYVAGTAAKERSSEQINAFLQDLEPYHLSRSELLQLLNLAPSLPVEVALVVEDCEGRLGQEAVQGILEVVAKHLAS